MAIAVLLVGLGVGCCIEAFHWKVMGEGDCGYLMEGESEQKDARR